VGVILRSLARRGQPRSRSALAIVPAVHQSHARPFRFAATRNDDFAFEFKWDGMRAIVALDRGCIRVTSRHGRDFSGHYPELQELAHAARRQRLLLDGEIICADVAGKPCFDTLRERIVLRDRNKIAAAARRAPVMFMVFDLLHANGKDLTALAYTERRARLDDLGLRGRHWETPPSHRIDGEMIL